MPVALSNVSGSANTRGTITCMSRLSSFKSPRFSSNVKLPDTPDAPGSASLGSKPKRANAPLPENCVGASGNPCHANLPFDTLPRSA